MFEEIRLLSLSLLLKDCPEAAARPASPPRQFERREIIKMGLGAFLAASIPLIGGRHANAALNAAANGARAGKWRVSLHHAHTGETYNATYRVGDRYLPQAFHGLNHFLRDFRTNETFPIDPHVVDIISMVQARTRTNRPLQIISGYRCPATNAMLRETSTGVAKNSFHMVGRAIDIRMDGYNTSHLRDVAKSLRAGGVGYYPASDFVHVDTGGIRYW